MTATTFDIFCHVPADEAAYTRAYSGHVEQAVGDVEADANDPQHALYDALWLGLGDVPDEASDVHAVVCTPDGGVHELDLDDPESRFTLVPEGVVAPTPAPE